MLLALRTFDLRALGVLIAAGACRARLFIPRLPVRKHGTLADSWLSCLPDHQPAAVVDVLPPGVVST
jgi:hypothetical protein